MTTPNAPWLVSFLCDTCQKRTYETRRDARRARHTFHRSEKDMQAYACPLGLGFHLGHRDTERAAGANLNDPRVLVVPDQACTTSAAEAMARIARLRRPA